MGGLGVPKRRSGKKKSNQRRVAFRRNRLKPARRKQWDVPGEQDEQAEDTIGRESVRAKGELSRKRTVVDRIQVSEPDAGPLAAGTVIAVRGQFVEVDDGRRVWPCTIRRILRTRLIKERQPVVVGDHVFRTRSEALEGQMTNLRSDLVREEALAEVARSINLGAYLLLGEGESRSGGADKSSILSDAYEALVAAIYIEEGLEEARDFVNRTLIRREKSIPRQKNYKSLLQEALAREGKPNPTYRVVYEEGPDHRKIFTVEALVDNQVTGRATGATKKVAEQRAAKEAFGKLNMDAQDE